MNSKRLIFALSPLLLGSFAGSFGICSRASAQTTSISISVSFPTAAIQDVLSWNRGQFNDPSSLITLTADGSTTLSVSSAVGLPTAGTLLIESEEIAYTSISGTTISGLTRGFRNTTQVAHSAGLTVHVLKYPTNTVLMKALLLPSIQGIIQQMGSNSTYTASLQSAVATAQTNLANALQSAVQ